MTFPSDYISDPYLNKLAIQAQEHAISIITAGHSDAYTYHNLIHTSSVAQQTVVLATDHLLSERSKTALYIAAWFHDSGYYESIEDHERIGANHAREFVHDQEGDHELVDQVYHLILKTSISTEPDSIEEQIIRDADLHYLGIEAYQVIAARLRLEWETTLNKEYTDREWTEQNLRFMNRHRYYTEHAKHRFQHGKDQNIQALRDLLS
ncbi:MAG: HD domain-containing protein [Flavobacteriales bacterium]|nr:HD domain-containing protein [Flavobacteriales bacterium]